MAQSDLKAVIRLRKYAVDEQQRALAALLAERESYLQAVRDLDDELVREQAAAKDFPIEGGRTFAAYLDFWRDQKIHLRLLIQNVDERIAIARDILADAFKGLKTFEIAQEQRDAEEALEQSRKAEEVQNEIGLNMHRRQSGN